MTYTYLATFESDSAPGTYYDVKTDGEQLTCNCRGWTQQTHYRNCPMASGAKCTCRARVAAAPKDMRTCKHVRQVAPQVDALGGISAAVAAVAAVRAGARLGPNGRSHYRGVVDSRPRPEPTSNQPVQTATPAPTLARPIRAIRVREEDDE
jgi:hypothetical protein